MELQLKKTVIIPRMPNFLRMATGGTIDLGELGPEEYKKFRQAYMESMDKHYKGRKNKFLKNV